MGCSRWGRTNLGVQAPENSFTALLKAGQERGTDVCHFVLYAAQPSPAGMGQESELLL